MRAEVFGIRAAYRRGPGRAAAAAAAAVKNSRAANLFFIARLSETEIADAENGDFRYGSAAFGGLYYIIVVIIIVAGTRPGNFTPPAPFFRPARYEGARTIIIILFT